MDPWESISVNVNTAIFMQENQFENFVCKMASIFSGIQCVNTLESFVWFTTYEPTMVHSLSIIIWRNIAWYLYIIPQGIQYIPRNMHTVFALLCFVVVIHRLIFPYPSGLLHWHCGNLTIAPVPAKQPWWIWINTSCEFIMNDCITTTRGLSAYKACSRFSSVIILVKIYT